MVSVASLRWPGRSEISAAAALQAGVFRHPLRYVRTRPDLRPDDLPQLP